MAKYKFEKLQKYINDLAILPNPDSQYSTHRATITKSDPTTETANLKSNLDYLVNKTALEAWLRKKKMYKIDFKQAKKKCFISIDKTYLAII